MALYDENTNTHATELNGSTQFWSIADGSQTGLDLSSTLTIEAWVKVDTNSSWQTIVDKLDGSGSGYLFRISTTGTLRLYLQNTSAQSSFADTDSVVITSSDVGKWVHLAVSWTGASTYKFYKNGEEYAYTVYASSASSIGDNTAPFQIGKSDNFGHYLNGKIEDVRVWSDVRTAQEIRENFHEQLLGTESNLEGYWKFNNDGTDETSNGNDLTNNNSATFILDIPFLTTKTNIGSTYLTRTGTTTGDYWYITNANQTGLSFTGDFSLELWICLETLPSDVSDAMCLINKIDLTFNYGYYLCLLSNDKLRIYVAQNGSNYLYYDTDSAFVTAGDRERWVHVAATFDLSNRTAELYKDGSAVNATKTEVGTMTAVGTNSETFYIGRYNTSTDYFYGFLGDVKAWSEERSDTDILNGRYDICDGSPANLEGCWSKDFHGYDHTSNGNTLSWSGTRNFYSLVPFALDGVYETPQCFSVLRLDDGATNYADNFADYTESNITYSTSGGIRWAVFNGTTSYLYYSDYDFLDFSNTNWSVSFVFNADSVTGDHVIMSQYQDSTHYFEIKTSGSALYLVYYNGSSYSAYTGSILSISTTYHVVMTQNTDGTTHFYVNGSDESLTTSGTYAETNFTGQIRLGQMNGSNWYDGKLTDVTMWRRELNSLSVSTIYNSGTVLRYPFISPAVTTNAGLIMFSHF